jgi:hypothetical protein
VDWVEILSIYRGSPELSLLDLRPRLIDERICPCIWTGYVVSCFDASCRRSGQGRQVRFRQYTEQGTMRDTADPSLKPNSPNGKSTWKNQYYLGGLANESQYRYVFYLLDPSW